MDARIIGWLSWKLDFEGWRRVRLVDPDYDAAFEWCLFRHKGNLRSFGYHAVRELRLRTQADTAPAYVEPILLGPVVEP